MKLSEIVDLKASEIDKEKSDPKAGKYIFKKKVYIDYQGVKSSRPVYRFAWCSNNPFAIEDWRQKWAGTDFVVIGDDYWPERGMLDASGHYVIKDVVLMKIPIGQYLDQRKKEITRSEMAPKEIMRTLKDEYMAAGVSVSDEEIQQIAEMRR